MKQIKATTLSLINLALRTKLEEGKLIERLHEPLEKLPLASSIISKIKPFISGENFIDTEVEDDFFATKEKAYMLELLSRPWSVDQGEAYEAAKQLLN